MSELPAVTPPDDVVALAQQRAVARADKDWARADELRVAIAAAGWLVADGSDGFTLRPRPPFDVVARLADLPQTPVGTEREVTVGLLVEGWPDDVRTCLDALLAHAPADVVIVGLDLGNVDGAGVVLHEYTVAHPDRVSEFHVDQTVAQAGWANARTALLRLDPARVHVVMDVSSVLDGDAISPLVAAIVDDVVAAGWKGADVNLDDAWRSVHEAGPGEVDVLLGYLFAVDTAAALSAPPHPKAMFYRNADLEWSLALREAGGRLVVPSSELPVRQERHRGYHDSDPDYRDAQSRKTYDRLLQRFRGKNAILHARP